MKYTVIANVNLEFEFEANSPQEAYDMAQNAELPANYVDDSYSTVKIIDENGEDREDYDEL